jgi:hypothetical protein
MFALVDHREKTWVSLPEESLEKEDKMRRLTKKSVVFLLVALLVMVPLAGPVMAGDDFEEDAFHKEDIRGEAMLADLLIVRPVGLLATLTGAIFWPFTLPFSLSEKTGPDNRAEIAVTVEKFIGEPIQYTFNRRLGDM